MKLTHIKTGVAYTALSLSISKYDVSNRKEHRMNSIIRLTHGLSKVVIQFVDV